MTEISNITYYIYYYPFVEDLEVLMYDMLLYRFKFWVIMSHATRPIKNLFKVQYSHTIKDISMFRKLGRVHILLLLSKIPLFIVDRLWVTSQAPLIVNIDRWSWRCIKKWLYWFCGKKILYTNQFIMTFAIALMKIAFVLNVRDEIFRYYLLRKLFTFSKICFIVN